MASDICEPARDTYEKNHKLKPLGDICDIDPSTIKPYDILCAGFGQPFSQAGLESDLKMRRIKEELCFQGDEIC